jgi:hypothetical protein
LEGCVEKRGFDVYRVPMHVPFGSDGQHCAQCAGLYDGRDRLRGVDPCTLSELLGI